MKLFVNVLSKVTFTSGVSFTINLGLNVQEHLFAENWPKKDLLAAPQANIALGPKVII